APGVEVPPLPPLPELPIGHGLGPPATTLIGRPGTSGVNAAVNGRRGGLVVEAASAIPMRVLLEHGIAVRLTSAKTAMVRLRLLRTGGRPGHRTLAGPLTIRVPARHAVIVQLKPGRRARGV